MSVVNGRLFHSNKGLGKWRTAIKQAIVALKLAPLCGAIHAYLVFYLPRPKTVKRDRPCVKPDLDKLVRAVLDALEASQIVTNDSQIVEIQATKCYHSEPKLKVYLKELD
jgi:crossover junction endodeoxyribonuclease RusA